ncbi:MAG TPA: hypothetical protein VFP87_05970 [Chitinophagaceae bacterium]|nr:hypothetical protein [Chitinophagaceae bacterium]
MKKRILYPLLAMTCFVAIIGSCKHEIPVLPDSTTAVGDTSTPCDPNKVYFQQQVLPVLVSNCAQSGCHDAVSRREGVILVSYNYTMSTGGISPGNPGQTKIWESIRSGEMPPWGHAPLSQTQKDLIYNWILQGAENLVCENACGDTVNVTYSLSVKPIITNKCVGCHSGSTPQGGIDLSTYTNVKTQVTNGNLWASVSHVTGFTPMPVGGTLSTCELTQIQKWINQGALNN